MSADAVIRLRVAHKRRNRRVTIVGGRFWLRRPVERTEVVSAGDPWTAIGRCWPGHPYFRPVSVEQLSPATYRVRYLIPRHYQERML